MAKSPTRQKTGHAQLILLLLLFAFTQRLLAGNNGHLWQHSVASTLTLTPLVSNTTAHLYDVAITGSGKGYAAGAAGTLLYINGTTVNTAPLQPSTQDYYGVSVIPGSEQAYVVGQQSTVFSYLGTSGFKQTAVYPPKLNDVHFYDTQHGYTVGETGTMRHTQNGGSTWTVIHPNIYGTTVPALNGVWSTEANRAYAVGEGIYVTELRSTGTATAHVDYALGAVTLRRIAYSGSYGYIVGDGATFKTIDLSGNVSMGTYAGSGYDFKNLHVFAPNSLIAVGTYGTIKYFNGSIWVSKPAPSAFNSTTFNDVFFSDAKNGYVVGSAGALLKASIPTNIVTGITWLPKPTEDLFGVTDSTLIDITTVDFPKPYFGFLGGYFNDSRTAANYARRLYDASERYSTRYWYDRLGRQTLSQNTKQLVKTPTAYSYTLYDALGRITEVGEKAENSSGVQFSSIFGTYVNNYYNTNVINDTYYNNWISNATGARTEVNHTYYDVETFDVGVKQNNLRKRVAHTTYEDVYDGVDTTYQHATHFSYDIHGNVDIAVQENRKLAVDYPTLAAHRYKMIHYSYDLISGKINSISYQKGEPDQFTHRYEYDADNRLTVAYTSKDNVIWDRDAKYFYYAHGPLARVEYGEHHVQGIDYAYTLQGWIKGVNSNILKAENDMGLDGETTSTNPNKNFARDAFGYTLGYYEGDYQPITPTWTTTPSTRFEASLRTPVPEASDLLKARHNLFNGNISHMVTTITDPSTGEPLPQGTAYKYDQLNRLKEMQAYTSIEMSDNYWQYTKNDYDGRYHNTFNYDPNGNITAQLRKGQDAQTINDLTYQRLQIAGKTVQNRLYHVNDAVSSGDYADDIDDQGTFDATPGTINTANNYGYSPIGQQDRNTQKEIDNITYTVYGKVKEVIRTTGSSKKNLKFDYDASNQRIAKHVYSSANVWEKSEYYLRDAQGMVMSIYAHSNNTLTETSSYAQTERHVYGSSRVGIDKTNLELIGYTPNSSNITTNILGNKEYEGSNHLGNVLTTIRDYKIPKDDNTDNTIDYFTPSIATSTDYYPFGVKMQGRDFSSDTYRQGFNGKEKDLETETTDFGERNQDGDLGVWNTLDPMMAKYPDLSPYAFVANSPILLVDADGQDFITYIKVKNAETGKNELHKVTFDGVNTTMENVKTGATTGYTPGTNQFVDDIVTSYNYIVKNGADVDNAMETVASSKDIHVEVKEINSNEGTYDQGEITYNFDFGAKIENSKTGEEGYQSPALGFWSEAYHAYIDLVDKDKKKELDNDIDKEETFVHVEKENKVIDKLKEANPSNKETKRSKYDDAGPGSKRSGATSTEKYEKKNKSTK